MKKSHIDYPIANLDWQFVDCKHKSPYNNLGWYIIDYLTTTDSPTYIINDEARYGMEQVIKDTFGDIDCYYVRSKPYKITPKNSGRYITLDEWRKLLFDCNNDPWNRSFPYYVNETVTSEYVSCTEIGRGKYRYWAIYDDYIKYCMDMMNYGGHFYDSVVSKESRLPRLIVHSTTVGGEVVMCLDVVGGGRL